LNLLGQLAFIQSDNDQARTLYNQAIPLYQHVGSVLGEANCLLNLGQLALRESDNDQARTHYNQALSLYQRIQDRQSMAITHAWLTHITDAEQHAKHVLHMDRLTAELNLPGFRETLRAIVKR
jgi:tetratricopeptide (TPR) repeat protein